MVARAALILLLAVRLFTFVKGDEKPRQWKLGSGRCEAVLCKVTTNKSDSAVISETELLKTSKKMLSILNEVGFLNSSDFKKKSQQAFDFFDAIVDGNLPPFTNATIYAVRNILLKTDKLSLFAYNALPVDNYGISREWQDLKGDIIDLTGPLKLLIPDNRGYRRCGVAGCIAGRCEEHDLHMIAMRLQFSGFGFNIFTELLKAKHYSYSAYKQYAYDYQAVLFFAYQSYMACRRLGRAGIVPDFVEQAFSEASRFVDEFKELQFQRGLKHGLASLVKALLESNSTLDITDIQTETEEIVAKKFKNSRSKFVISVDWNRNAGQAVAMPVGYNVSTDYISLKTNDKVINIARIERAAANVKNPLQCCMSAIKKEAIKTVRNAKKNDLTDIADHMLQYTHGSYVRVAYGTSTIFNPYACTSVLGKEGKQFVITPQDSPFAIHVPCYILTFGV
ncbi:hypothetical protein L596_006112 [Steinernema carpocapsae]|uniref:Uncharacterized protein n=1 Tax=Steinernema carpocapsae TaxID=34508 RepID=A0A4U8V2P2_STECR|nr:hypothetical protein L596_006112 [Steinernema carpocapsae]